MPTYDLHFDAARATVADLARVSPLRLDLYEVFEELLRTGAAFVCHLDVEATNATGHRVLRYEASERFKMLVAAATLDWQETEASALAHDGAPPADERESESVVKIAS